MFTVALIGADGAGKTTITRRLVQTLPLPVKYIYMGINLEASNLVLPTTRLWLEIKRAKGKRPDMLSLPDPSIKKSPSKSLLKRVAANLKSSLRVANLLAEEWFRQSMVWFYQHRGTIVIFDRHFFFDYYFHHIVQKASHLTLSERIHGFVLNRFYPKPDLVICLDAPAEVLLSRKGEATLAFLQRRRQEYLLLRHEVKNFVTVDATQPADVVLDEVTNLIQNFYQSRSGREEQVQVSPQPLERNSLK